MFTKEELQLLQMLLETVGTGKACNITWNVARSLADAHDKITAQLSTLESAPVPVHVES